jgi:oligosaccharyltransferase complex subunit beta
LTLSSDAGTPSAITSLLLELDIHLSPDRNAVVIDHFNYDVTSSPEKHDILLLPRPGGLRSDVKSFFSGDGILAVPRPVGQALGNASPLLMPILRAGSTAYSYNPKEGGEDVDDPFATGAQIAVVSAMQARNSARFTVLGSWEMFRDEWFGASVSRPRGKGEKTVNREFARQVTEWTFKEVGVLRVNGLGHYEVEGDSAPRNTTRVGEMNPSIYRIKNDVVRFIDIPHVKPHPVKLTNPRPSPSPSRNTRTTPGGLSSFPLPTPSNSNSPCCPHSSASPSMPSLTPPIALLSQRPSASPTSTAFSLSRSTISGLF